MQPGQLPEPASFELITTWSWPPVQLKWIHLTDRVMLSFANGELCYLICSTPEAWRKTIGEMNTTYHHA